MFWQRKTNQLAIIYFFASLALIIGTLVSWLWLFLLLPFILVIYIFYKLNIRWLAIGLMLFVFCLWRGSNAWPDMGKQSLAQNFGYGRYVGVVINEPTIKINKAVLTVKIIKFNDKKINGLAQVEADRFVELFPGDEIEAVCKIMPAKNIDNSWQTWLVKDKIIAKCFQAKIKKIGAVKNLKYYSFNKLLWLKQKATLATKSILPEPYASLLAGILWGARAGLPNDLQQTMKSAGITHIIAISGYNVSLITVALANWLVLIGLSKKQMAGIILVVLFAFVVITGASASVMRAAIMGGFIVVVKLVQRKARPIVVLPLALFVMGLFNPLALLYDAGLHLSFLATVGLLVVNPLLEKKLPAKTPGWLKESAVTTFSATLMTAPYSWWQFGQLTLAGLVTNLLVVPIVPCVMAIGALAVGFYFILPILSLPWATIVHFLLATIIYFAKVTSEIPSL